MNPPDAPAAISASTSDRLVEESSVALPRFLLTSKDLLGERREVRIEHEGSEYVLRATRNGKLILTK